LEEKRNSSVPIKSVTVLELKTLKIYCKVAGGFLHGRCNVAFSNFTGFFQPKKICRK